VGREAASGLVIALRLLMKERYSNLYLRVTPTICAV
jgi:hypothetical protein